MSDLAHMQHDFIADCVSDLRGEPGQHMASYLAEGPISPEGLMSIYRDSTVGNIIGPMQLIYPVVEKLVGEQFFQAACKIYIQGHWPTSGNMDEYGEEFAAFLTDFPPASNLPYLADVATLEWLHHESALADVAQVCDWSALSQLSPEKLLVLQIHLAPSLRMFSSAFPVHTIWAMNQEGADEEITLDLSSSEAVHLMVVRKGMKVDIYPITEGEVLFLQALQEGKTLGEALDILAEIDENISLESLLLKYLQAGVFSSYSTV